jgi:hypothetical protein
MAQRELDKLETLDLRMITLSDVQSLKNHVLRRALLEVVSALAAPAEHTSHGTHSNHYKTMAIDGPIVDNPVVNPRPRGGRAKRARR